MRYFHERFNDAILNGTKDTTVRREADRCVGEIEACVNPGRNTPFAWIQYMHVYRDWDLGTVDATREGFTHIDDLIRFLNEVYDVKWHYETKIVIYQFKLVKEPTP